MYSVLLVDDDESILEINETYLQYRGYEVRRAKSIKNALELLETFSPNCIVLDVLPPDGNSVNRLDKIEKACDAPVIFLSSLPKEDNIIDGLVAGGDDYVTKPFSPKVLELRIAARIRSELEKNKDKTVNEYGALKIDTASRAVSYKGNFIPLTSKEFNILQFLSKNVGNTYQLNDIYTVVWGMYDNGNPLTVQSHVSNLRKKIKSYCEGNEYIKTVWGNGYKFSIPE